MPLISLIFIIEFY